MVFWMRRHGRTLKKDLERRQMQARGSAQWWGLLVVVALAVGRETAETVVFLYGVGLQQFSLGQFLLILALGLGGGVRTFWLLQRAAGRFRGARSSASARLPAPAPGRRAPRVGPRELMALGVLPPIADQLLEHELRCSTTRRESEDSSRR